jgi:hypothetical protein
MLKTKLATAVGILALSATPALAAPGNTHVPDNQGTAHMPDSTGTGNTPSNQGTAHKPSTPGPQASPNAKAKAYGKFCQGESKKHVAGTPGTPFSKCVTDMAKLANGSAGSPRSACKNESKKHVAGMKGTPFSQCVSGAAKLQQDQQQQQS